MENESGAGGLTAANNLATTDPEEPAFHIVNTQGILGAVLADAQGVQYDPDEYTWVARLTEDTRRISRASYEAERRLRTIESLKEHFEASADGVVVLDDLGCILFVNGAAESITGFARDGLVGSPLIDLVPHDQRGR